MHGPSATFAFLCLGNLQACAAQRAVAIVGQENPRSLVPIQGPAASGQQTAALSGNGFNHPRTRQALGHKAIAGREPGGIPLEQLSVSDGIDRREQQTYLWIFDRSPEQSGRVDDGHLVVQLVPLLHFGHRRFVPHTGDAPFKQRIHQGRFADIGDTHDQHTQRLDDTVAMGRDLLAQAGDLSGITRTLARQGHGRHALLLIVLFEPGLRDRRVGEIGFVQDLKAWTLPGQTQFLDQWIAAGLGDPRIQHLDDDIDRFHRLGRFFPRGIHVTGKPLYRHDESSF